jgi:aspartate dehydrogenase
MRVVLLGGGTIARLALEHARREGIPGVEIVAVAGRPGSARAAALAREFGIPYVAGREAALALRPQAVVEAASHDAVREHLVALLEAGVSVVVLSAGALADDALRRRAEQAAERTGALLYVPSGGIGGLDALKTACLGGVDEASIQVAKPPAAWKGIAYVESLGVALDRLTGPHVLFEGPAREREHRGGARPGRHRHGPHPPESRCGPVPYAQYAHHPGVRPLGPVHGGAGERAFAG